jgi:hypothetical protein
MLSFSERECKRYVMWSGKRGGQSQVEVNTQRSGLLVRCYIDSPALFPRCRFFVRKCLSILPVKCYARSLGTTSLPIASLARCIVHRNGAGSGRHGTGKGSGDAARESWDAVSPLNDTAEGTDIGCAVGSELHVDTRQCQLQGTTPVLLVFRGKL